MKFLKRNIDIIIILVIGFALRFTISFTHSYSNDELSAINRLQYDSFSALINQGVKTGDMHPAGVQLFMKVWSQIAGVNEMGMRFPFVICGTLSILLIFLIGKRWVNRQTGLIAAIFLSLLYFPIMNSEFARPYSPGLMFCLLSGWLYLKVLFEEKTNYKTAILLGLSMAAAMYIHHFAFLFIAWIGVSGLIFVRKNKLKYVLLAGAIAILLYLPHIPITQYQLSVGGLQWLGAPEADWLVQFIYYAFNASWIVMACIALFSALVFVFKTPWNIEERHSLTLAAIWFFGIYIVAHIYSITQTPILKFPVMLFALPFLLLLISTWLSRFKYQGILFSVLMLVLGASTSREKELFGNMHYELFEEVAEDIVRWRADYGEENIYTVYNLNNPNYMNFYANQMGDTIHFDWDVLDFGDAPLLREDLVNRDEEFCIVGYSARLTLPQVFETCKEFYPNILEYKKYNNAAVFLLSKNQASRLTQNKALLAKCTIHSNSAWTFDEKQKGGATLPLNDNAIFQFDSNVHLFKHVKGFVLDSSFIYGPTYEFTLAEIEDPYEKYIKVNVKGEMENGAGLTAFVSANRDGEQLMVDDEPYWQGYDLETMIRQKGKGYFVFKIPEFLKEDDVLKIGLWSRFEHFKVVVQSVEIEVYDNIWN